MKILHICRQFSPSVGGLEDSLLNLARSQRQKLGLDAQVLTLDSVFGRPGKLPHSDVVDGVPVTRIAWRGSTRYPLAPGVLRHIRSFDLLHVHAIDFFFDFLAWTWPLHRKVMIASTHGGFFHTGALRRLKEIWFRTITPVSVRAYARIVACSYSDADMFRTVAKGRLQTIENGINQTRFRDAAARTPNHTILAFGRFAVHKRLNLLFELVARLRRDNPQWKLIVAGQDSNLTADDLRQQARACGIGDSMRIVPGPSDAALRDLMGEASFFGCLSAHEGFGLAAVEAMSAGLVPILSNITPFVRLMQQGAAGVMVDPADMAAGARDVESLATTLPETADALRARNMDVASRYDWNSVAREYATVYQQVLGGSGSRSAMVTAGAE
ncbi:glycosyltransferase family 4 protein [Komagataeibacter sp. FNDCF1]|uniref:glycosyltransferase family 4 protein n=1 Tax=Komagataeibacter sp. FNDCF1 TaxID=2878681 RepID=UPI001E3AC7C4|nr:glycosyltransferase family 4 protein [Komagataeibacter sp. FNDCF1]MCE2566130.1 glycosyltransferase family 4 protein [Komagataeibacter sp. FNDCF1]